MFHTSNLSHIYKRICFWLAVRDESNPRTSSFGMSRYRVEFSDDKFKILQTRVSWGVVKHVNNCFTI